MAVYPGDTEETEEEDVIGYVHSYEVGSTVDGPGIRFVGFLTGCLLRCEFCHNPDTWHKHNGHQVTVSPAMRQIGKYAQVLKLSRAASRSLAASRWCSGKFVTQIFRRCKALGHAHRMETSGRLGDRFTDAELQDIDLQILDIKGGDPATFEKVSGHPQAPTLEFRAPAVGARAPGLDSLRAGAGPYRRPRQRREAGRVRGGIEERRARGDPAASTRWAATSGTSSALAYPMENVEPPTPR